MFATGVFGTGHQTTVGAVVLGIGEALNVTGFHCDDRSGDVTDAWDGEQSLHEWQRSELCLEVFFELLAVLGSLKTLLMVHHQGYPIFFGDGTLTDEISEA
jgi:hypothetical protein